MSSLLRAKITPTASPNLIDYVKKVGLFDIDDRDDIIPFLITAAIEKLQKYTSLVLLPSTVQANYVQHGKGDRIEMFFCNGIPLENNLPIIEGLPENTGISGIDGGYFIHLSGEQDINISYSAGFTELPEWAKLAIAKDVIFNLENQGSEQGQLSQQAIQIAAPFRNTLHEIIL